MRGDTSGKVMKPARIKPTNHEVLVPLFCETGNRIEIDTRTNDTAAACIRSVVDEKGMATCPFHLHPMSKPVLHNPDCRACPRLSTLLDRHGARPSQLFLQAQPIVWH